MIFFSKTVIFQLSTQEFECVIKNSSGCFYLFVNKLFKFPIFKNRLKNIREIC